MAIPLGILPHDSFKALVGSATLNRYRGDPRVRVTSRANFDEMKNHIVSLYDGVDAEHSYEDPSGRVVDCIPIEQQPSLRGRPGPNAAPPDLTPVLQGQPPAQTAQLPLTPGEDRRRDRHGNPMSAPAGTIPMRRVTIEDVSRFASLSDFLLKQPGTFDTAPSVPGPDVGSNHRYAYTEQTADNLGGHNSLAVYAPAVNADQVFSLAQHWYSGGDGDQHQTIEVGWQVYPAKYGHANPVIFTFWTSDNYKTTGAYNLDAPGFVQTNNNWTLGGTLSPVSVQGGQQMEIEVTVYLFAGNWWIYLGGITAADAVGYYPTALYGAGQLASNAQVLKFGGETVCQAVAWPGMGSGAFPADGWQHAAYQRNIYYFPKAGGAAWAGLTPEQPSPDCYKLSLASAAAPWGIYFFYGGTGGGNC
ncbi:MAG: neprosin family prolyl endopeptidase [Nocardioidaceae bacterium]